MLFNHSEIIPVVLLLPVVLNILLPLGVLAAYLLMRLIRWGLSPVQGTAAAKPEMTELAELEGMAMTAGADSPAGRGDTAIPLSVPGPALQG